MKSLFHLLFGLALLLAPLTAASAAPLPPTQEIWRVGFLVQRTPSLAALDGRLAMAAAEVQSARGPADTYFAFPAQASNRWVTDAKFYLLARSGSYSGELRLTLAVFDAAGRLKRVVSKQAIDLQTASAAQWTALEISPLASARLVSSGEILAFHAALSNGQQGSLLVQPIFEVSVENMGRTYLPLVRR